MWTTSNPVEFAEEKLNVKLDEWQKEYILTQGNTAVRAGRQSGKSFSQSIRTALFALLYKSKIGKEKKIIDEMDTILITAGFERQAYELYMKVRRIIEYLAPQMVKGRPTMEKLHLTNGIRILALPGGRDGAGLRNFNVVRLVVDEAHYVQDEVYNAIEPMLATTGGDMDLLSTPKGNIGKFYDAFQKETTFGKSFTTFHTTSEECERIPKAFLQQKKESLTKMQYAQEYLAEFQDALQQFFPIALIDPIMKLDPTDYRPTASYIEGMDIAGWGLDETTYCMFEKRPGRIAKMRNYDMTQGTNIRQTLTKMRERQRAWKTKKVIIDSGAGGGGGAIFDLLIHDSQFKKKIIGINNSQKSVSYDNSRRKVIIKEDMYNNAKRMMEMGEVELLKDNRVRESLLSIQFEWTKDGNFRIFGAKAHATEGIIRALWFIAKEESLKCYFEWN